MVPDNPLRCMLCSLGIVFAGSACGCQHEFPMSTKSSKGADFLVKRSAVTQAKQDLPQLRNVLMVEDLSSDAKRLRGLLHIALGRDCEIRLANSLDKTIDEVLKAPPDLIFLDDYLRPADSALDTIPLVRRAGYTGPIVVFSGELDRARTMELKKAGACECLNKDDINSVEIGAVLVRVFAASKC